MNRTYCRIFLIVAFFYCSLQTYGQEFLPGYVVKNQSDTVSGLIFYQDWEENFNEIEFKNSLTNQVQRLSAEDISAFYITATQEEFRSKAVQYNLYLKEAPHGVSPVKRTVLETIFLKQVLRTNAMALYYTFDEDDNQRFFFEKGNDFVELFYCRYLLYKDGSRYEQEQTGYKNQLQFFLSDCKKLDFDRLTYSQAAITELLLAYANCSPNAAVVANKPLKEKYTFDFLVSGGVLYLPASRMTGNLTLVGLRTNLPRKFRNRYLLLEVGKLWNIRPRPEQSSFWHYSIFGGSYFGKKNTQFFTHVGLTKEAQSMVAALGIGVSYAKKVHFELRGAIWPTDKAAILDYAFIKYAF